MKIIKFIPILTIWILLFTGCPTQPNKMPTWDLCCTLPDSGVYKDIFFIDADEGWLVGEFEKIYHTTNGGENWELQHSDYGYLFTIHFIDKEYGWATGFRSAYYTIDGGASWNYIDLVGYGRATMPFSKKVFFIDRENVLVFSCMPKKYYACVERYSFDADSGKFTRISLYEFSNHFSSITNLGCKICFADIANNIYLSKDCGETWSKGEVKSDSGEISVINDINFADEENGWFCTNTSVYHSEDGGNSWYYIATLPDSSLRRICFKKNEGWVMGERIIYHSSDGGESWEEQFEVNGEDKLVSLSFVNRYNGWALSEKGRVYRYGIE